MILVLLKSKKAKERVYKWMKRNGIKGFLNDKIAILFCGLYRIPCKWYRGSWWTASEPFEDMEVLEFEGKIRNVRDGKEIKEIEKVLS